MIVNRNNDLNKERRQNNISMTVPPGWYHMSGLVLVWGDVCRREIAQEQFAGEGPARGGAGTLRLLVQTRDAVASVRAHEAPALLSASA